jgi:hypothetical protein
MTTLEQPAAQEITDECPLVDEDQIAVHPVDRIWVNQWGVPLAFSYKNEQFTICDEPLLWFGRRSWWEAEPTLLPEQRRSAGLEQAIWRAQGVCAGKIIRADLMAPVVLGQVWRRAIL